MHIIRLAVIVRLMAGLPLLSVIPDGLYRAAFHRLLAKSFFLRILRLFIDD